MSDEDYNAQGTFYFPAGYRNETQYIAFWDTVTVPDKVLRAILGVNGGLARSKKRERLEDLRARALRERERIGELEKLNTDLGRDTEGPFLDFFRRSLSKKEGELGRIENELANLREAMVGQGMGVFAVVGAREAVDAFFKAYLDQPSSTGF